MQIYTHVADKISQSEMHKLFSVEGGDPAGESHINGSP
jgi:hypothetical protein